MMDTVVGKTTLGELLPYIVVVSLLIIFIVFCIAMAIKTSKIKKKQKKELKDLKAQGLTCQITANHTYGCALKVKRRYSNNTFQVSAVPSAVPYCLVPLEL